MDARVSLALRRAGGRMLAASQMAADLGLAPPALAAALDRLAGLGFVIEQNPLLGLRLAEAPPALLAEEIACDLSVRRIGRQVRCVAEASSTNDLAWAAAAREGPSADGWAVFAEQQSAGRGRRGNRWLAPPHSSVLGSVLLWMADPPAHGALLTRAAAVAVAEAVESCSDLKVGIKWPNDLVIEDRKIGGILVEARPVAGHAGPLVVGIGLNCTQGPEAFPPEIRPQVAGLSMFGDPVDRTLLARALLTRLDDLVGQSSDPAGQEGIRRKVMDRCRTLGRRLTLTEGGGTATGEVIDLDPDYGLLLRLPEGGIRRFPAMTSHVVPA
jgi:BirA family transcriptional regulator, biotin operon repressor / biotin---[acetyl-CoA-carboxylase] ligase